jgi:hypothetical protein
MRLCPTRAGTIGVLAAIALLCLLSGQAAGAEDGLRRPRVLLVGVDGMTWSLLLPLLREGRLPEMAALMERGTFGKLGSLRPTVSPVIWTTIATGKPKEEHGILGFTRRDPSGPGGQHPYSSSDRKTKAFWDILGDAGRRVNIIGWWATYPAEPIHGLMVSQTPFATQRRLASTPKLRKGRLLEDVRGQVQPPEREAEMLEILRSTHARLPQLQQEIFGELRRPPTELGAILAETFGVVVGSDATYVAIARKVLSGGESFDLTALYLGGIDVLQHRFWRYMEPEAFRFPPTEEEVASFKDVIPAYYAYVDRVIGELRRAAGDGAIVIVLSDHGAHPINLSHRFSARDRGRRKNSGGHHSAPPGVLIAAGPGLRALPTDRPVRELDEAGLPLLGRVQDITPTLLALLDVPVGADMDGKVLVDALDPAYLAAHPIRSVPTHDTEEWLRSRTGAPMAETNAAEMLEQLRAIGYIE